MAATIVEAAEGIRRHGGDGQTRSTGIRAVYAVSTEAAFDGHSELLRLGDHGYDAQVLVHELGSGSLQHPRWDRHGRLDSPDLTIYSATNPASFSIKNKPFSFTTTNRLISKTPGTVLLQSGWCELVLGKSKAQVTYGDILLNRDLLFLV